MLKVVKRVFGDGNFSVRNCGDESTRNMFIGVADIVTSERCSNNVVNSEHFGGISSLQFDGYNLTPFSQVYPACLRGSTVPGNVLYTPAIVCVS